MESKNKVINANHDFYALKLFNYHKEETDEQMNKALLGGALSHAPSNNNTLRVKREKLEEVKTRQNYQRNTSLTHFKARPLNKKILESKGELGLFCIKKRQVTIPQEFHFAINERIPLKRTTNKLFDKSGFCLESYNKKMIRRFTIPCPFHLHTEERGAKKESKFVVKIIQKKIEEGQARIPNSHVKRGMPSSKQPILPQNYVGGCFP